MPARTPPHIVTLILLSGIAALNMNIFIPSLSNMANEFGVEYRVIQLSISLYLALSAVVQMVIGPVSDKWGRRPILLWSLFIFVLMTLGCILAPTAGSFLFFRMGQAVVATSLALSRAAVRDIYDTEQAASRIAYVTMGMALVPMFSPAIGGWIDDRFDWVASFWVLLVLGAGALALTYLDFGETKQKSGLSLFEQFREYGELLRAPRFWGYALASGLSSGTFFAYLGGASFVGIDIYGLDTKMLGWMMSAPAVGYFIGNFMAGRFSRYIGLNRMIMLGCLTNLFGGLASLVLVMHGDATVYTFFGLMVFVGLGNGMCIPNATAGAISVRPHLAGSASGLSGAVMIGVGAALAALAGRVLVAGSSPLPLLLIMCVTAFAGVLAIIWVIRRERALSLVA
ncbi:Bcr/CflA family efflux MFS transporter [Epibacterium sp. SM1969]|uniref:Bcr/CflA family efflux transporter n=1 Tax=Tritonibacter aquimaris TaxID=2663379 RepID=A0A844B0A0_9RHOB|nr:multidrug effflux MFS transporter [Tritonibacter aquimaris]MQY42826.1 Bcr/CflA family efflux MFS transporter [Tritonibacter aquimaris]